MSTYVDYDFWARLIVGKTFFQTGTLLNFDFQSFGPTRQWFDHEWGSSLIFYGILDNFGETGLIIFKIIMNFLIIFMVTKIILLRRKHLYKDIKINPIKEAPLNILFFILLTQSMLNIINTTVRCQVFTFFFFLVWFYTLEKSRLENNRKILWILPVTMILWSNIHGGCFTGLGLLGLYIVGEFLNKKPVKHYVIAFITSLFALFINPYGIKYVYFLFHAITMKRPSITEWQPLWGKLHFFKFFKFKIWSTCTALISAIILIKKYNRIQKPLISEKFKNLYQNLDKTKAIVLIVMFLLSLKTIRLIPFFTISAAIYLYDDIYTKIFNKKMSNVLNNIKEIFLGILILISFVYTMHTIKIKTTVKHLPYLEAEFLKINNLKGNLLADFHQGSFLAYKLYPNNFIFMDGRYEETYDPKLLKRLESIHIGSNWQKDFDKQHIDYIILDMKSEGMLYQRLLHTKEWYPAITGNKFILLIRKDKKIINPKLPPADLEYYDKHKWETNINWR